MFVLFLVDASQAGEGQLEISINDGEVPNHVQVLGGGKCLVSFTPEMAKVHTIEIKLNGVKMTVPCGELLPTGKSTWANIVYNTN